MTTDKQTTDDTWREVGRQFQALGESLATAFRTAWESEENRQHLQSMKVGLEAMVDQVGQAIQEASASLQGEQVRREVKKATESARAAGAQALQEAQPHLLSALRQINAEIQKMISRMEQKPPAPEGPAAAHRSDVE